MPSIFVLNNICCKSCSSSEITTCVDDNNMIKREGFQDCSYAISNTFATGNDCSIILKNGQPLSDLCCQSCSERDLNQCVDYENFIQG